MAVSMLSDRMLADGRRRHHKADVALLQDIRRHVATLGLHAAIRRGQETKVPIERRGLLRVADVKLDVIDA